MNWRRFFTRKPQPEPTPVVHAPRVEHRTLVAVLFYDEPGRRAVITRPFGQDGPVLVEVWHNERCLAQSRFDYLAEAARFARTYEEFE